jgi:hypothetical protein
MKSIALLPLRDFMKTILPFLLVILLIISCQETTTKSSGESPEVIFEPDSSDTTKILIRDNTGKKWDITHAVNEYGFDPEGFQFGAGPFAIKPILQPQFMSPGDLGYDSVDQNDPVIGVSLFGNVRAYPLKILRGHEIVDEKFDSTHVAVGY